MTPPCAATSPFSQGRSWKGELELAFGQAAGRTVLKASRMAGPLRVQQLFYGPKVPGVQPAECIVLHPPGGLVSGDELYMHFAAEDGAKALLTTPSAAKIYQADGHFAQRQAVELKAAPNSELIYLPQETLIYDGADACLSLSADAAAEGTLILSDLTLFGRAAAGEGFARGQADLKTTVRREGRLIFTERLRLDPKMRPFAAACALNGRAAALSLYLLPPCSAVKSGVLERTDEVLKDLCAAHEENEGGRLTCGSTILNGELIALRALSPRAAPGQRLLRAAMAAVFPLICGRPFVPPRIWLT